MHENLLMPQACEILEILPQTETEWTFRVANDRPIGHGQFMQLSLPGIGEAPMSVSGFGDGYVDFTIRKVGKLTDGLFNLRRGDSIFLRGCYGNGWPMEQLRNKHVVILAGGTGVSPVKSLINMLYNDPDYAKDVYLVLGFKTPHSILFAEELRRWKSAAHFYIFHDFHVIYTLDTGEAEGWHKGLITNFLKDIPFATFEEDYECLVVGPPAMMKFTGLELLTNGVQEKKIWMTLERKMSCGIRKCGHCRIDDTYICLDGPVFNFTRGKMLVD